MKTAQYIPRTTEKAYAVSTKDTYVFFVPANASKQAIAKAIAEAFKVTVIDVRTAIRKGKKTRFSKGKHAYPGITYRRDHKVAYITVKQGDKIPVFEEIKEDVKADKADKKAEKVEKKAAKKATKAEAAEKKTAKKAAKKDEKESA